MERADRPRHRQPGSDHLQLQVRTRTGYQPLAPAPSSTARQPLRRRAILLLKSNPPTQGENQTPLTPTRQRKAPFIKCDVLLDPACGSGNFLVIAYKELRRLEHSILERMAVLDQKYSVLWSDSRINIENFYGIEIDDFAVEIAILSMWIAKHQMNTEFWKKFGNSIPLIPLKETDRIRSGNAARLDWGPVCLNNGTDEIYVIGNPRTEELRSCRKGRGKIIRTYLGNGRTQKIWTTLRFGL